MSIARGPWRGPPGARPSRPLEVFDGVEQLERRERRVDAHAAVQEAGLVEELADRIGVIDGGAGEELEARRGQGGDGLLQVSPARLDVRAQAEIADAGGHAADGYSGASRQTSTETSSTGRGIGGSGLAAFTQTPSRS